jgi:CHAT domain-containing protein
MSASASLKPSATKIFDYRRCVLPSAKPTDFDDGLLTASEIAQLKLDADWVVLSACNTAAEEKPGAEALSGLARAFFYAGG